MRLVLIGFTVVLAASTLCLTYAYFIEPNRLIVKHDVLNINGWDPAFDGLRIAMIGDIHGGSNNVTAQRLHEIVALTNAEKPDLIVLLGDYVSQVRSPLPPQHREVLMEPATIFDNLAGFQAPLGVYAVLGNHDGSYGDERVAAEMRSRGFHVLQNEVASVERNGHHFRILGMKDHLELTHGWNQTANEFRALLDGGDGDVIALEHSPDIFPVVTGERLISPDLKLFLAAHTHGGQVWLPVLERPVVPSSFGQKYAYGHIFENDVDMYVTSGIGTSVLPIRFMVPPEIVILTIRTKE